MTPRGSVARDLTPAPWTIGAQGIVRDANGKGFTWSSVLPRVVRDVNQCAALLAEVERLRDALTNIDIWLGKVRFCDATPLTAKAHEIARAALAQKGVASCQQS